MADQVPDWLQVPPVMLQILGGIFATYWIAVTIWQRSKAIWREERLKDAETDLKLRRIQETEES